jgi:protein-tyrosine-phosphatase
MRAMETRNERQVPIILVISQHDSARAQMAVGYLNHLLGEDAIVWSGGRAPDPVLSPEAVVAMAEDSVDISGAQPKPWNNEIIRAADVVVNIGDHEAVPVFAGRRYLDWAIEDPGGDPARNRQVRDDIKSRVTTLVSEIREAAPAAS